VCGWRPVLLGQQHERGPWGRYIERQVRPQRVQRYEGLNEHCGHQESQMIWNLHFYLLSPFCCGTSTATVRLRHQEICYRWISLDE